MGKIKQISKIFVDKIAAPLYIYCVQKIVMFKNIVIMLFKAAKNSIIFVLKLIQKLVISFCSVIVSLLKNLNGLYFNLLWNSRKALMSLGIFG